MLPDTGRNPELPDRGTSVHITSELQEVSFSKKKKKKKKSSGYILFLEDEEYLRSTEHMASRGKESNVGPFHFLGWVWRFQMMES